MPVHSLNETVAADSLVVGDIVAYRGSWWRVDAVDEEPPASQRLRLIRPDAEPAEVLCACDEVWRLGARAAIHDDMIYSEFPSCGRYKDTPKQRAAKPKPAPAITNDEDEWAEFDL